MKSHSAKLGNLLLLVFLLVGTALSAFGQENSGSIQGTVKDEKGAAIAGAEVIATSPSLVRPQTTTTDNEGRYNFPTLPIGMYTVTASQSGFSTTKKENIDVRIGTQLKLDLEVPVAGVSGSVTVTSNAEALDVTSSKTGTNITERFIETTPKGRGFNSILTAAPGVIFDTRAGSAGGGMTGTSGNNPPGGVGGYSVNGASGSENAFIIDGVEVSNVRNAALGRESAIPFEFVREVQVQSGGFEAQYGGATGGVVNVITKSGSDEFHGEGAVMFSNSLLNSRVRGFWQRSPTSATTAEFFRSKEDDYTDIYPGGSLSGPILKNRLHFFTSYFPEFHRTERSINFTAGPRTTVNRLTRHFGMARLDWAPTSKIQVNTSYLWTPIRSRGLLTGTDPRITPPTSDLSKGGGYTPATAYTASFTWTPTSKVVLSARYGYKYLNDKGNTYGLPTNPLISYSTCSNVSATTCTSYIKGPLGLTPPAAVQQAERYQNTISTFNTVYDITTRHNIYLDGSYLADIAGQQHILKGGFAINRIENRVKDDYPNGLFIFNWGEGFTRGTLSNARGEYGFYTWRDGIRHDSGANSRNEGFYVQDQWKIHPHVTLNLGVRFENEFLPPFTHVVAGKPVPNPIVFGWGDKIAPRLGGAWDVRGDGKWKLSASWGEFFDTMKYELARSSFGGDYWHDLVYKLDNPDTSLVSRAAPGALGSLIIDIDNRTIPINAQGQLDGIDPAIKPMLSREFTVSSEHQFRGNMFFSGRWTRKRLVRGIEDIGVLDAAENEVYTIGNMGFGATDATKFTTPNGVPLTPKGRRDYDGVEFRLDQRFTEGSLRNFSYFASYTWSRLYGNWAGLANSDEAGRSQPNVSRAFDLSPGNFDQTGHNVFGRLATDRPHQAKFFGNYLLKTRAGSTSFSLSEIAYSGTPLSSEITFIVPIFYKGRGNLGRTPTFTQTDVLVAHTIHLTERVGLKFDANITNLFNQAVVTNRIVRFNRNGSVNITEGCVAATGCVTPNTFYVTGFDAESKVNGISGSSPARNVIYNLPNAYQGIREIRLGVHLNF
ncbi:MAG: TonB-dependent receptor [Acidobacteriota bacterium]|nr:TonB-dependent receptor [Acidobacteriota bacterium]